MANRTAKCLKCKDTHPVPVQRTANGRHNEGTHGGCKANVERSTIGEGKPGRKSNLALRQARHDAAASLSGTIPTKGGGFRKTSGDGAGQTFHRPGSQKK